MWLTLYGSCPLTQLSWAFFSPMLNLDAVKNLQPIPSAARVDYPQLSVTDRCNPGFLRTISRPRRTCRSGRDFHRRTIVRWTGTPAWAMLTAWHVFPSVWISSRPAAPWARAWWSCWNAFPKKALSGKARRSWARSYRKAWLLLQSVHQTFGAPAVVTETGGAAGGGSRLTELGTKLVRTFRAIEKNASGAVEGEMRALSVLVQENAVAHRKTRKA